jgi:hypothetical protein
MDQKAEKGRQNQINDDLKNSRSGRTNFYGGQGVTAEDLLTEDGYVKATPKSAQLQDDVDYETEEIMEEEDPYDNMEKRFDIDDMRDKDDVRDQVDPYIKKTKKARESEFR